ncbi:hypothetical protein Syun_006183 [Stephania yunnanensis]|uniref:Bowman-Birk serine protease inhibitors family domain-containing protein n=1 Tax=Stephania yunnanensis TaxID=152371 RepID=A0AAP0KXT3_9MAGN
MAAASKLVMMMMMMGVVLVALLGASPSAVQARTHVPSILTTSETLENIDLDSVFVTGSNSNKKAISGVRSALASLGINKGIAPIDCGGVACCDKEICIVGNCPKSCRCMDVGESCHAACEKCTCTPFLPPQCRCMDVTPYSYGPCPVK